MIVDFSFARRRFARPSRPFGAGRVGLVAVALLASACSGGEATLADPTDEGESPTAPSDEFDTPENLAFANAGRELRLSVSSLQLSAPHDVVETNAEQVLLTDLLTDGLTQLDPESGAVEPAIAESFEIFDGGLTWFFFIGDATNFPTIRSTPVVFQNSRTSPSFGKVFLSFSYRLVIVCPII